MVDSLLTWATQYKIDAFRFDLMGHHSLANMLDVRASFDALTPADDGVDGTSIYIYGEGWNFGEVADDARFIQATQLNLGGTGSAPSATDCATPCVAAAPSTADRTWSATGLCQRPVLRPERFERRAGACTRGAGLGDHRWQPPG